MALVAAAVAIAPGAPAADAPPAASLERVEKSLETARQREARLRREASEAAGALNAIRERAVRIAANAQAHEETLVQLGERLVEMKRRRAKARATLADRRARLGAVLAALQRLSMHPPVALIALPATPADTIRSALLLRGVAPAIEHQAQRLRDEIDALTDLAQAVEAAQSKIAAENIDLARERATLAKLIARRAPLARRARGEADRAGQEAQRLGREASDLRDLVARLARERAQRKTPVPSAAGRRTGPETVTGAPPRGLPVRGRVIYAFGARNQPGGAEGVTIRTLPNAQVVAPTSGTIVFAGPFRGLGRLLIIEYRDEYHLLLAGLSRMDAEVGDTVLAGEPVGVMDATGDPQPTLYLELRRKGRPINPLPWLAARQTKVNG